VKFASWIRPASWNALLRLTNRIGFNRLAAYGKELKRQCRARIVFDCPTTCSNRNALAIGIQFSYDSSTIPMRFFRELDPFASHVAVAALAIVTWVFLIVPL
jgi:hypothetical protein